MSGKRWDFKLDIYDHLSSDSLRNSYRETQEREHYSGNSTGKKGSNNNSSGSLLNLTCVTTLHPNSVTDINHKPMPDPCMLGYGGDIISDELHKRRQQQDDEEMDDFEDQDDDQNQIQDESDNSNNKNKKKKQAAIKNTKAQAQIDPTKTVHYDSKFPYLLTSKQHGSGMNSATSTLKKTEHVLDKGYLDKKAWELVMQPVSALSMNMFMIWMMGSSGNLWSILMVGYAFTSALGTLKNVNNVFLPYCQQGLDCSLQKIAYCFICCAMIGFLLYNMSGMGLIPTQSGDWVGLIPDVVVRERML